MRYSFAGLAFIAAGSFVFKASELFARSGAVNGRPKKKIKGERDLVCVRASAQDAASAADPYSMTVKAIGAMGGMERFVKKGGTVVVKPNIGWDRTPEQAANTNPLVVAAVVELCFKAGAKKVNVFDNTCNDPRRCYDSSGIREAAKRKGANVFFPDLKDTVAAKFSYESPMEGWPILRAALECDTFINVPVLKHHGGPGLTLSMKNLMGVCSGNRGLMHDGLGRKVVDLTDFINPELTVIDGIKYLERHGPTGGSLSDVRELNTVIVSTDPTLADAYASHAAGKDPMFLESVRIAAQRKLGNADIGKADILVLDPRLV